MSMLPLFTNLDKIEEIFTTEPIREGEVPRTIYVKRTDSHASERLEYRHGRWQWVGADIWKCFGRGRGVIRYPITKEQFIEYVFEDLL